MNYIAAYLVVALLVVLCNAFIAIAINNDAAARDLKKGKTYAVLAFFFPLIVGIIYGCIRKKMEKIHPKVCNECCNYVGENVRVCPYCSSKRFSKYYNDKSDKLKKSAVIFTVLAVVLYIAGVVVGATAVMPLTQSIIGDDNALPNASASGFSYYDREGNSYTDPDDVIFYAKDGSQFVSTKDETYKTYFVNTKDEAQRYDGLKCFVDKDGYFVYDNDGAIVLEDNLFKAKDSEGNIYYPAEIVTWNSSGEINK